MTNPRKYAPGAAFGADIRKTADIWTLVLVRTLRHPPAKVWHALTDPAELREWAPYDADRNLGAGGTVMLTTVGAPSLHVTEGAITRADAPSLLEFTWGGNEMRWELEPVASGTRLTLWHNINRNFIAMGAAGWHICIDVLDHLLDNHPIGRIVGSDAMQFDGWQRLHAEYARQFGIETPGWPSNPK
jgi:uncharacterized protein YndB with AHSA1/START domain